MPEIIKQIYFTMLIFYMWNVRPRKVEKLDLHEGEEMFIHITTIKLKQHKTVGDNFNSFIHCNIYLLIIYIIYIA